MDKRIHGGAYRVKQIGDKLVVLGSCDRLWKPATNIQEIMEYIVQLIAIWNRCVDYTGTYCALLRVSLIDSLEVF